MYEASDRQRNNSEAQCLYDSWCDSLRLIKSASTAQTRAMWVDELEQDHARAKALQATGHLVGQNVTKMGLILNRSVRDWAVMVGAAEKPLL